MRQINSFQGLIGTFGELLTVAIHLILYERQVYPSTTFKAAKRYNFPVQQNRHPGVCDWIRNAVSAVEKELLRVRSCSVPWSR